MPEPVNGDIDSETGALACGDACTLHLAQLRAAENFTRQFKEPIFSAPGLVRYA